MQKGTFYRYFRIDTDHDVSAYPLELSLDGGDTWSSSGVVNVSAADHPRLAAIVAGDPPARGMTAYWWQVLTGPTSLPIPSGAVVVRGRLAALPEVPEFAWSFTVGPYD